jgi:hypothetical protein
MKTFAATYHADKHMLEISVKAEVRDRVVAILEASDLVDRVVPFKIRGLERKVFCCFLTGLATRAELPKIEALCRTITGEDTED